jgi:hypothetical protein
MIGLGLEEPLPPQETIDELCVHPLDSLLNQLLIWEIQTPNILRQNPSVGSNDT